MLEQYLTQANATALELEDVPASAREEYLSCKKRLNEEIALAVRYISGERIPLAEVRAREDEILRRLLAKREERITLEALREADEEIKRLSAQYGDMVLKKYDMDAFLSAKKEMDEFKSEFEVSDRSEKQALMPRFLELDEKYKKAKQKIAQYSEGPQQIETAINEYDVKLARARERKESAEKAMAARSDRPSSPRPSGSGAVTSYLALAGQVLPPAESAPAPSGEALSSPVSAEELAKLDARMNILNERIDMSKAGKLPSDRTDVIIEKLKLQSDLEIAKLRTSVERFKKEISDEMDKLSEEINSVKETVLSIKADAESVRVSAEIARKAKNAAAMNAQKAVLIAKRLSAIVKYLSSDDKRQK